MKVSEAESGLGSNTDYSWMEAEEKTAKKGPVMDFAGNTIGGAPAPAPRKKDDGMDDAMKRAIKMSGKSADRELEQALAASHNHGSTAEEEQMKELMAHTKNIEKERKRKEKERKREEKAKEMENVEIDDELAAKIQKQLRRRDQNLERLFDEFDIDQDGDVSEKEFLKAVESIKLGLTEEEAYGLMHRFDTNHDGSISYREFAKFVERKKVSKKDKKKKKKPNADTWKDFVGDESGEIPEKMVAKIQKVLRKREDNLDDLFAEFDGDGDGDINEREFLKIICQVKNELSEEQARRLMHRFDKDGDGRISYKEFMTFMDKDKDKKKKKEKSTVVEIDDALAAKIRDLLRRQDQCLYRLFEKFDRNGDGRINEKEFLKTAEKLHLGLSDEQIRGLMKRFDKDGDGRISTTEFIAFVENKKEVKIVSAATPQKPKGAIMCEQCKEYFKPDTYGSRFSGGEKSKKCKTCEKPKVNLPPAAPPQEPAPPPKHKPCEAPECVIDLDFDDGNDAEGVTSDEELTPETDPANWVEYFSEEHDAPYYFNEITENTSWEWPACLGDFNAEEEEDDEEGDQYKVEKAPDWAVAISL
jgi:Ca2+-binding EF-hand superfamily protein